MSTSKSLGTPGKVKVEPATALPWIFAESRGVVASIATAMPRDIAMMTVRQTAELNAAYLCHAANAYPKLVEALKNLIPVAEETCKQWPNDDCFLTPTEAARKALQELGESN